MCAQLPGTAVPTSVRNGYNLIQGAQTLKQMKSENFSAGHVTALVISTRAVWKLAGGSLPVVIVDINIGDVLLVLLWLHPYEMSPSALVSKHLTPNCSV